MFIGHFAPALIAAKHKDAPSLPLLFVAGQLVDWGFFIFLMFGIESARITPGITAMNPLDLYQMPYTHSLLGGAVWAAGFAVLIFAITRNRMGALIGAVVVLSHWLLDVLVHAPDMTLVGGKPKLGMGLWNYPLVEMPLELGLIGYGLWLYGTARRPAPLRLLVLALLLVALQQINWFGPPPAAADANLALTALAAFAVATLAAGWTDRSKQAG